MEGNYTELIQNKFKLVLKSNLKLAQYKNQSRVYDCEGSAWAHGADVVDGLCHVLRRTKVATWQASGLIHGSAHALGRGSRIRGRWLLNWMGDAV